MAAGIVAAPVLCVLVFVADLRSHRDNRMPGMAAMRGIPWLLGCQRFPGKPFAQRVRPGYAVCWHVAVSIHTHNVYSKTNNHKIHRSVIPSR